jgi:ABC-2 type transport system permease protein
MPDVIPNLNEYVVTPFYQTLLFFIVCLVPLLVMSSFPRDRQLGTYEILCTSPLRAGDLVTGTFGGLYGVLFVLLLAAFTFPALLFCFSSPELLPILVGFLGVLLFGAALLSIGLAVAAFCRSQATAAFASFFVLFGLYLLDVPAAASSGTFAGLLRAFSPSARTMNLLQGVILLRDIVFLLSLTVLGQFASRRILEIDRWR